MRDAARLFLERRMTRRHFVSRLTQAGVAAGAAAGLSASLDAGQIAAPPGTAGGRVLHDMTGGEVMAEFLIDAGIDPKHKDVNGDTALHVACRHSLTDVADLLLDRGLDIEAVGHWNMRPLETAAATDTGDPTTVVKLLLARGANINAKGFNGHTALHECAFYNRQTMADLLLSRGADPNVKDNDGRTPADLAIFAGKNERWRMINQFYKRGGLGPDGKPGVLLLPPKDQ